MNYHDPIIRLFAARMFSTALCCICIVIRPLSRFGGATPFLVLTFRELAFPIRRNLTSQLEVTVLSLIGALIAITLSALSNYLVTLAVHSDALARTIRPLCILVMSFIAGFFQSRLPRLRASMRIGVVTAIWMLTSKLTPENIIQNALNFLWIVLVSSISSLLSALLFLTSSTPHFADATADCFQELHDYLSSKLSCRWADDQATLTSNIDHSERLLLRSIDLCSTYSQAAFDLRIGRVDIKRLKPLVSSVEHIRRELAWGLSIPKSYPLSESQKNVMSSLQTQSLVLGETILRALSATQKIVKASFKPGFRRTSLATEKIALSEAELDLEDARKLVRAQLKEACAEMELDVREELSQAMVPQSILDACLCTISLLQMSHEAHRALTVGKNIASLYEESSPRLWYPRFSWAWLGVEPSSLIQDQPSSYVEDDDGRGLITDLSQAETMQGLYEQGEESEAKVTRLMTLLPRWWKRPAVLKIRLKMSRLLRAVQHSPHIQYGVKLSAGLMVLGIPAFLPTDSAGYHWFRNYRGQWMLISYVWVLEGTSGGTWRIGYLRLLGTILGAIYAFTTWAICRTNPYGLVVMVTAVEIPISWVCLQTSFPSLGTVTYITLPPLVFAPYFIPTDSVIQLSFYRVLLISVGIIAALLINSLIFRRNSRVLFLDNASRAISHLDELYLANSRDLFGSSPISRHDRHKALVLELSVRNTLQRMSGLLTIMSDELSLRPKPMRRYKQAMRILQKLLDTLTGLRKIREHIPRHETVEPLVNERRELMSCICVCLFACENVFNTRQPLPQFLPSSREALRMLEVAMAQRLFRHHHTYGKNDTMIIYALAEIDILRKMVETMEDLLKISRQLFGTAEWFARTPDTTMMMSQHESRAPSRVPSRAPSPSPPE